MIRKRVKDEVGMAKYAQVAVYVPGVIDQFDYLIPQTWRARLRPGHLVEVLPGGFAKIGEPTWLCAGVEE